MGSRSWNILSLCSGYGGLDLALRLAVPDARTICMVEREGYLASVLVQRMEEALLDQAPVWTDLRTFDGRPWRGKVHCIASGFPCQPFSKAGRLGQQDDPRYLWPHVGRIIGECGPPFVFIENVANLLRRGFELVQDDLRSMGYRVAAGLFTAAEAAATHYRERMFVLAWSGASDWPALDLGDPDCEGLEGRQLHEPGHSGYERPTWPPGPEARADWMAVLEQEAHLEPGFCRVADGRANFVDRIRACGNGVVPAMAALAFTHLSRVLGCPAFGGRN